MCSIGWPFSSVTSNHPRCATRIIAIAALTATLAAALDDPADRRARADRARARALRDDTWQAVAARRHAMYREMLGALL